MQSLLMGAVRQLAARLSVLETTTQPEQGANQR